MTRIEKIKEVVASINNMRITNDGAFFSHILPDEIKKLFPLIEIETDNPKLIIELEFEKSVYLEGAITFSKMSSLAEDKWKQEFTLRRCKALADSLPGHLLFACYQLGEYKVLMEDKF